MKLSNDSTLHEALLACGFTHRSGRNVGRREIVDGDGRVVFVGHAGEAWAWLKLTHDLG